MYPTPSYRTMRQSSRAHNLEDSWRPLVVVYCTHRNITRSQMEQPKEWSVLLKTLCYEMLQPIKMLSPSIYSRLLMVHRNSAMKGDKSPAEIMLGRTLRCPIINYLRSIVVFDTCVCVCVCVCVANVINRDDCPKTMSTFSICFCVKFKVNNLFS